MQDAGITPEAVPSEGGEKEIRECHSGEDWLGENPEIAAEDGLPEITTADHEANDDVAIPNDRAQLGLDFWKREYKWREPPNLTAGSVRFSQSSSHRAATIRHIEISADRP